MTTTGKRKWLTPGQLLEDADGAFGRSWLYEALRTGKLAHIRVGNPRKPKILIPDDALDALLDAQKTALAKTASREGERG